MLELVDELVAGTATSGGGGSAPAVIEELNVTPSTSAQTITAPEGVDGYSPVNVSAVTSSIDANIVAGNIKSGVDILGVTGSLNATDVITATNNTGADILAGDKVWINNEPFYSKNFDVIGSPTIDYETGVVSGFSTSNYLQLSESLDFTQPFKIYIKFTTPSSIIDYPALIGPTIQYSFIPFYFDINSFILKAFASSNGTSWNLINDKNIKTCSANTTYTMMVEFTGSAYIWYEYAGGSWVELSRETTSTACYASGPLKIGQWVNHSWNGSIDLSETYIQVNGQDWWVPTYNKLSDYTIENYSSFDSSNLKINGTLNISNGIASGFGVSNFITVGNTNFDLVNHWSFETEITTGNDVSTYQMIFPENRADYNSGLQLSGGYFGLVLSNTHTSVNIGGVSSITIASANTTYKLKVEFTGTAYNLYVNDILEGTLNSTAKLLSWIWNLGCANTNNPAYAGPFLGSINLNKTKITADGFTWTPNIQNVSQNSLTGYTKEVITNGSTGEVLTLVEPKYYAYKDLLNRYVYCQNIITSTQYYYNLNARSDNAKATSISELTVPSTAKPASVSDTGAVTFNIMVYYRSEQDDLY